MQHDGHDGKDQAKVNSIEGMRNVQLASDALQLAGLARMYAAQRRTSRGGKRSADWLMSLATEADRIACMSPASTDAEHDRRVTMLHDLRAELHAEVERR